MRTFFRGALVAAIAASLAGGAQAAAKPSIADMSYFNGSWSCKTVKSMDPKSVGKTTTSVDKMYSSYLAIDYGKSGVARMTYNPHTKTYVYIETDNNGDYVVSETPGWVGSVATWKPTLSSDGDVSDVVVITKKTPTSYDFMVAKPAALTKPEYETACTKS